MLDAYLDLQHLQLSGKPSSPFDPLRLFHVMLRLPKHSIVFSPGYNAPLFVVRPFVFSIMDLNHLFVPANSSFAKRAYYYFVIKRACHKARRVITISEFSRTQVVSWSGLKAEKVVNVGVGVEDRFSPVGIQHSLDCPYLLYVGSRKPHKNLVRLLKAFSIARIDQAIFLLLSGAPDRYMCAQLRNLGLENRVRFAGFISEENLPSYYRGALALAFPSLYEGFGLPVLEAMACGTPVLTSNATSLPEVVGDAGLMVDPYDVKAIAAGIERLVEDYQLREKLRTRGLERAKRYTWERTAEKTLRVLQEAMDTL